MRTLLSNDLAMQGHELAIEELDVVSGGSDQGMCLTPTLRIVCAVWKYIQASAGSGGGSSHDLEYLNGYHGA